MNAAHLAAPGLLAAGFAHGFSLPPGDFGVTPEGAAHATLARAVGYSLAALRTCRQVHGAAVLVDPSPDACAAAEADALVLRAGGAVGGAHGRLRVDLVGRQALRRGGGGARGLAGGRRGGAPGGGAGAGGRAHGGAPRGAGAVHRRVLLRGGGRRGGRDLGGLRGRRLPAGPGPSPPRGPRRGGAGAARVARGPRGGARRGLHGVCANGLAFLSSRRVAQRSNAGGHRRIATVIDARDAAGASARASHRRRHEN
jgi:hypothetical protein